MIDLFFVAQTASGPTITIGIPAVVAWVVGAFGALIAIIGYFLHRELKANDQAHKDLRSDIKTIDSDVKKLLAGDVAWVRSLLEHR